ncbi:M14 family zinc carboxypeptidase [Nesterenkonia flava]|uniref:M14 family zinc carboxypeptidase n=1 Tax=Nesterenkonia flava TaxID=469799 RepID=A0ABU1FTE9_9MICC|nr:M14 family zinc carboxypeptidase [Nesterenkonia flava]MDR5711931.1 M14 family zinc carboxypeptidase [Nesterenkonia flava]
MRRSADLPPLHGYPTVDELHAMLKELRESHPQLVKVQRIGTSRLGEPLVLYTLTATPAHEPGQAAPRAGHQGLLVGGVHPNEPIGSWTIVQLFRDLAADESLRERLDTDWHAIPCADPDGMRLNEGWFREPGNPELYYRNFYRPAGAEQVEWTFPFSYKRAYFDAMMPETQALQRAIDLTRPDFYVPLHNAESGGAYYYLSEPVPELYELLATLPEHLGIPLHLGEPEAAHFKVLAPAVFEMGTLEQVYDWMESLGLDPAPPGSAGQASTSYASKYGTLSMIAELPIWKHDDADDTTSTDANYAEVLRHAGQEMVATGELLEGLLHEAEAHLSLDTPFRRAANSFIPGIVRAGHSQLGRAEQPENQRLATVAELSGPMGAVWMFRLRFGGSLLRALTAETDSGLATAQTRRLAERLEEQWSRWLREKLAEEDQASEIPVRDVVGLQYGAVLGLAAHVRRTQ